MVGEVFTDFRSGSRIASTSPLLTDIQPSHHQVLGVEQIQARDLGEYTSIRQTLLRI